MKLHKKQEWLTKKDSPKTPSPAKKIEQMKEEKEDSDEEMVYNVSQSNSKKEEPKKKEPKKAKSAMFIPVDNMIEAEKDDLYINFD